MHFHFSVTSIYLYIQMRIWILIPPYAEGPWYGLAHIQHSYCRIVNIKVKADRPICYVTSFCQTLTIQNLNMLPQHIGLLWTDRNLFVFRRILVSSFNLLCLFDFRKCRLNQDSQFPYNHEDLDPHALLEIWFLIVHSFKVFYLFIKSHHVFFDCWIPRT